MITHLDVDHNLTMWTWVVLTLYIMFVDQVAKDLHQHILMLSKLEKMQLQDVKISSSLVFKLLESFAQDQL
jgi:hypothetical protein